MSSHKIGRFCLLISDDNISLKSKCSLFRIECFLRVYFLFLAWVYIRWFYIFKTCTPACMRYFKCSTAGMGGYKHLPTGAWPGQQSKQRLRQVRIPQQLGGTQMSHTSQNPLPCQWLALTATSRKPPAWPKGREKQKWKHRCIGSHWPLRCWVTLSRLDFINNINHSLIKHHVKNECCKMKQWSC